MILYMETILAIWLRMVNFTELKISKSFFFEFQLYELSNEVFVQNQ